MKLSEGLFLYEVVLLILGVVMFVALVGILIYYVKQRRQIKPLLLFFGLPVVMIGFPAIKKITFNRDGMEIEKKTAEIAAKPPSAIPTADKTDLRTAIEDYRARADDSAGALIKVARAEVVLGAEDNAARTLAQALRQDPKSMVALDLKARLDALPANYRAAARHEAVNANASLK